MVIYARPSILYLLIQNKGFLPQGGFLPHVTLYITYIHVLFTIHNAYCSVICICLPIYIDANSLYSSITSKETDKGKDGKDTKDMKLDKKEAEKETIKKESKKDKAPKKDDEKAKEEKSKSPTQKGNNTQYM